MDFLILLFILLGIALAIIISIKVQKKEQQEIYQELQQYDFFKDIEYGGFMGMNIGDTFDKVMQNLFNKKLISEEKKDKYKTQHENMTLASSIVSLPNICDSGYSVRKRYFEIELTFTEGRLYEILVSFKLNKKRMKKIIDSKCGVSHIVGSEVIAWENYNVYTSIVLNKHTNQFMIITNPKINDIDFHIQKGLIKKNAIKIKLELKKCVYKIFDNGVFMDLTEAITPLNIVKNKYPIVNLIETTDGDWLRINPIVNPISRKIELIPTWAIERWVKEEKVKVIN